MKKSNRYLGFIDALKGIAIFLVVYGHFFPVEARGGGYEFLRSMIYSFHMPLFMIISGFLFAHTRRIETFEDYVSFIKRQSVRLMVPYFMISFLIIGIKLCTQQFVTLENPVTLDFWKNLLFNPMGGFATFLWFMYTLFLINLIFPLLDLKIKNVYLIFTGALILKFIKLPSIFCLNLFAAFLVHFVLGVILYIKGKDLSLSRFSRGLFGLGLIVLCFMLCVFKVDNVVLNFVKGFFIVWSGAFGCWHLSRLLEGQAGLAKFFALLGSCSGAIYLFHTMSMAPVKLVLHSFMIRSDLFFVLTVIAVNIAGLVGPIIVQYFINKSKIASKLLLGVSHRK